MSIHTSSNFIRLMDRRLTKVWEQEVKRQELKSMIPVLFGVEGSDSAFEEFFYTTGIADIPEFNGKLTYLSMFPGFHKKVEHKEFAAGLQFERKLIDDKKWPVLDDAARKLGRSMMRTKEKWAARAFTLGTSTAFDFMTSEEGKPLFSSSHLTKTGVSTSTGFDNTATSALDRTGLAAVRLKMRKFKLDTGERYEPSDSLALIVPDNLADTAREIVGSQKDPESANNAISSDYGRYQVIPYLRLDDTDTNDWYMVDMSAMKEDLKFFNRINPEPKSTVDFDTYAFLYAIYGRWAYAWKDWRWGIKSTVS